MRYTDKLDTKSVISDVMQDSGIPILDSITSKSALHLYAKILVIILVISLYESKSVGDLMLNTQKAIFIHAIGYKVIAISLFSLLAIIGIYISKQNILYLDDLIFIAILAFINFYKWRSAGDLFDFTSNLHSTPTEPFTNPSPESLTIKGLDTQNMDYKLNGTETGQASMYPLLDDDPGELVNGAKPEHYDFAPDDIPAYLASDSLSKLDRLKDKITSDKNYQYNHTIRPYDRHELPGISDAVIIENSGSRISDLFGVNPATIKNQKIDPVIQLAVNSCSTDAARAIRSHIHPANSWIRSNGVKGSKYRNSKQTDRLLSSQTCSASLDSVIPDNEKLIGTEDDTRAAYDKIARVRIETDSDIIAAARQAASTHSNTDKLLGKAYAVKTNLRKTQTPTQNNEAVTEELTDITVTSEESQRLASVFSKPSSPLMNYTDGYSFASDGINTKIGGNSIRLFDSCTNYNIPTPESLKRISDNCARRINGTCL